MWWNRWKRRWWRPARRWRRWRRRRPPRRRRRGTARYPRRRRVRRWRRRGRGWGRRRFVRRFRRLRRRKKIVLTQWNPSVVRKCVVRGYIPLLICGTGTTGTTYRNYGSHISDYKKYDPFGGGFSTMQFTLSTLYDEYQKHRNTWSKSNVDLELVRYKGCSFRLYREKDCDFIFRYNRKPPFTDSQLTGPSLHAGMLMTRKKKKLVKSYSTKPKGRSSIIVRMRPPTLFNDRWYFQKDICKMPLINISATACNLRFPFGSPQTDNTCIYFQVLSKRFNTMLSISPDYPKTNWLALIKTLTDSTNNYQNEQYGTLDNYNNPNRLLTVFNTFMTEEHIFDPNFKDHKNTNPTTTSSTNKYKNYSSLWGDFIYKSSIVDAFKNNANKYFEARKGNVVTSNEYLNHKTGLFSPIFLSAKRLSPDFPGFYQEVIYNPANDKGVGNKVWMDWCTKNDSTWRDTNSKLPVVDIPLWAALQGYSDYCTKFYNDPGLIKEARVTIICPYTQPPLTDRDNTDMGWIPYDYNFGNGLMPDGQGYIPIPYRMKWYPCMFHQQNWMNDIVKCGPFAYQGDHKKVVLTCRYKFHFLFGGNPISQQTLKDPCQQPTFPLPGPGGVPPRLQIENPKRLSEGFYFRAWDIRRGLFGKHAIKRVQEQPYDAEYFAGPPKKSKFEVPALPNDDYISEDQRCRPWQGSTSNSEVSSPSQSEEEETETPILKQQLRQQLREQKLIKKEVTNLIQQLVKTQLHLHAPICQP
nr:MAG: ORF1 [Torque teno virus]